MTGDDGKKIKMRRNEEDDEKLKKNWKDRSSTIRMWRRLCKKELQGISWGKKFSEFLRR